MLVRTIIISLILILFIAGAVVGDGKQVPPGGTVFLGEEGIDISASGIDQGGQIGWWAPGSQRSSAPTELISVSSPQNFYVSPSQFSGKEGLWYTWPEGNPVFIVKKPSIKVKIYDESSDFDATGKWLPRGDTASFRIESNVYEASSRGLTKGSVDIRLFSPQGGEYSSVSGPSGSFSLTGISLTSPLTSTGPVWNTGGVTTGTWRIIGEITLNGIKNNLAEPGAGVSEPVEVLIQNVNPLITSRATSAPAPVQTAIPADTRSPFVELVQPEVKEETIEPVAVLPETTSVPQVTAVIEDKETSIPATTTETPVPERTQAPLGLIPVIGGLALLVLVRKI